MPGKPVARIGDMVWFPDCGKYPLVGCRSKFYDDKKCLARVGDKVKCGGKVITGSKKFLDAKKPVARVGDKATCPGCKTGRIITGSKKLFDK